MRENKDKEMFLNACFEEYKTLREESKQASINMITSMSIGIGVAAIAMVTGITSFKGDVPESIISLYILCGIIPFLIALITSFWLGEAARFKRAGDYICFIESKISIILDEIYQDNIKEKWSEIQKEIESYLKIQNSKLPLGRPMQWEHWLRDVGHMKGLYIFRLGLLILAFIGPMVIGLNYAFKTIDGVPFSFDSITALYNNYPYLLPWILSITCAYFVFIYLYTAKLKVKTSPIPLDELLSKIKNK